MEFKIIKNFAMALAKDTKEGTEHPKPRPSPQDARGALPPVGGLQEMSRVVLAGLGVHWVAPRGTSVDGTVGQGRRRLFPDVPYHEMSSLTEPQGKLKETPQELSPTGRRVVTNALLSFL